MSRIKICGLSRIEDIEYVNCAKPDYAGFVINFPKSHRNVPLGRLVELSHMVDKDIKKVGVFVNQEAEEIARIAEMAELDYIQLHGNEDEAYIEYIKNITKVPVIKAFVIKEKEDVRKAKASKADYILLDSGQGSGQDFDWRLLEEIDRDFFLAGGISTENIETALRNVKPYAVDVSSGVETSGIKDIKKIMDIVQLAHKEDI